jgi:phosphoenolpyruvate carboxykinase (ATP)
MYHALAHSSVLLENVMINAKGEIDFLDERLAENGRGVLNRRELKVKRGGKLVSICADSINLPSLEELDGVVFAFITRRGTIMPFAQRLTPEQGVALKRADRPRRAAGGVDPHSSGFPD